MNATPLSTTLDMLRQHKLLPGGSLDEVATSLPHHLSEAEVAAWLEKAGCLTGYQAERLRAGRLEELVVGPYGLLEPTGGSSGFEVFKARHSDSGQLVLLTLLKPEHQGDGAAQELLRKAKETSTRLNHPRFPPAVDGG